MSQAIADAPPKATAAPDAAYSDAAHSNLTLSDMTLSGARLDLQRGDADAALTALGTAPSPGARPEAWHALRGMALLARERWRDAEESLRRAVAHGDTSRSTALNLALAQSWLEPVPRRLLAIAALEALHPDWDEPPFRLAEMLRAEGRANEAAAAYERALLAAPGRPGTLLRLATLHIGAGSPRRAESLLIRCCGVAPLLWEAWDALGITSSLLSDHVAGRIAFRRALSLAPGHVPVAVRLAAAAAAIGDSEAELAQFELMSRADPCNVALLAGRARLLEDLGRDEDALQILEAAVAIDPQSAPVASLLADRLLLTGRHEEALAALRHAAALDPDSSALRNNLAVALTRTHRYGEALSVLDAAIAAEGERVDLLTNRTNALVCLGRQEEGVAAARRAIELAGHAPAPLHLEPLHLAWRTLANALAYSQDISGAELSAVLRSVAATAPRSAAPTPDGSPLAAPCVAGKRGTGRLRLGLLSAALKTHPVGWFTASAFENLDPERFEIVCIGQREGGNPMQRRFRAVSSEWHPWAARGQRDLARKIRGLSLDMLIDMGGYGDQGMLSLCAQRLAPVQVKWVGMQNHTTGMAEIDWFVTDRWSTPPELAPLYTERLLVLPDGYVVYSPPVHAPPVAQTPALRPGGPSFGRVTFGCFNNLAKVTPQVIAAWSMILHAVPGARLLLKAQAFTEDSTAASLLHAFASHGITEAQLELRGGSPHRELLAQYADVDIALDPFPYSGGLTTCEAMWQGVPVLTMPGETFASRHSASHLSNVGLRDWVMPDLEAYLAEAVRRAADLPSLAALRSGLRERMRASPLCDAPRFGRHLGLALERAWSERHPGG